MVALPWLLVKTVGASCLVCPYPLRQCDPLHCTELISNGDSLIILSLSNWRRLHYTDHNAISLELCTRILFHIAMKPRNCISLIIHKTPHPIIFILLHIPTHISLIIYKTHHPVCYSFMLCCLATRLRGERRGGCLGPLCFVFLTG